MFDRNHLELYRARHQELVQQVEIARLLKAKQEQRSSKLVASSNLWSPLIQMGWRGWDSLKSIFSDARLLSHS